MPLIRDYTDSELVNLLSDKAEILFARLLTKADGHGNYTADPILIKSTCFPRKDYRTSQISTWLKELATEHLVGSSTQPTALLRLYEANGKHYLHILKYGQTLKFKSGKYPPPDFLPDHPKEEKRREEETEDEGEGGKAVPAYLDFECYVISKMPEEDFKKIQPALKLKYESWVVNGWKDGNGKKIKTWKSKILNTIPYLQQTKTDFNKNFAPGQTPVYKSQKFPPRFDPKYMASIAGNEKLVKEYEQSLRDKDLEPFYRDGIVVDWTPKNLKIA